ncbi:MAG: neutral/alkaline non-lysosomal ceramidase N-terminal domain-containing protein [Pyrinomonadaceae bacterium]
MLSAGFSKVCISPPIGAPLAGFAARQGMCEGIHDDLFSRALVIEKDGNAVAFVSLDVLAVSSEFVGRVRENIRRRTGIKKEAVMIAATHTHAGPVTVRTFFNPDGMLDKDYMERLAKAVEDSVAEAFDKKFPARVGVGSGYVSGIGVNRRTEDKKPIDEEIGIIKVEDLSGETRGVFINYACHPTVLGSNNLLATGDFPYFTVEKIEQSVGGFAMFVNGTQGNISMGHSSELSAIGIITPGRTFEHAEELGNKLADAALAALPSIETAENAAISAVTIPFPFPLKKYPPPAETAQAMQKTEEYLQTLNASNERNADELDKLLRAKSAALYASIENFYAVETEKFTDRVMEVELQGIRVGDAVFIAVPAEVFVEIGLQLKKRAPQKTYIVGIANGYIGYLPTDEAYKIGGYEVVSARCAEETHELLIDKAIELEKQLFGETIAA